MVSLLVIAVAVSTAFSVYALVDCFRSDFPRSGDKTRWILMLVCAPMIGALAWFRFRRTLKRSRSA